jgi:outer membrane protein OmpA-like peptidoglycan-associated protein
MNKLSTLTASVLVLAAPIASAEPAPPEITAGVGTGAVAGALLAGPPGAIVGAALGGAMGGTVGAVLEERAVLAAELDDSRVRLAQTDQRAEALAAQMAVLEARADTQRALTERLERFEQAAIGLSAGVHFRTGSAELDDGARQRLADLAEMLALMPDLVVHLEGHADVRGDPEANLTLSGERARTVERVLASHGVSSARIQLWSYGAEAAQADPGDAEGLAFDRRVDVLLLPDDGRLARSQEGSL